MSLFDYQKARQILADEPPFDALIMAAALRGDPENRAALQQAFPDLCAEARRRFNTPGGRLPEDGPGR